MDDDQHLAHPEPAAAEPAPGGVAPRQRSRRARRTGVLVAGAVVLVAAVTAVGLGVSGTGASGPTSTPGRVVITSTSCGAGWVAPSSGTRTFDLVNDTRQPFDVDLVGANQVDVYADLEVLAPGTNRPIEATMPPGTYAWRCEGLDGTENFSPVERVTGQPVVAHPFVPVAYDQIQIATINYRSAIKLGLAALASDTDRLTAAVEAGQLAEAEALWLPAHLDYERLGAAYDTFGQFNQEINGLPNGLEGGVDSPRWAGFHRLEYGLWGGQPLAQLVPVAVALDRAVHGLEQQFPLMQTGPNDVALRTHEILENTLQFQLTGEADFGSHTTLATALANVEGTETALRAITPLLAKESRSELASAQHGLASLARYLSGFESAPGVWTPLQDLSLSQREALDANVSELVEQLAPIPDLLQIPANPNAGS